MTIRDLLASAGLARIDADVMLAFVMSKDRAWLTAHDRDDVSADVMKRFGEWAQRRAAGEPVAYIVGEKEFYGRPFAVRPGVLIPRPCTEELVIAAISLLDGERVEGVKEIDSGVVRVVNTFDDCTGLTTVVDVGTGSGCIAVTLACERPEITVIATDISDIALDITKANAERQNVLQRIDVRKGSALDPVIDLQKPFLVVTNPPYVKDATLLGSDVRMHEPHGALFGGGADGGDVLRSIVRQARTHPGCRGIVAECLFEHEGIVSNA